MPSSSKRLITCGWAATVARAVAGMATWVNSLTGQQGSLGTVHGPMDSGVLLLSIRVSPSGAERTTSAPPMVPPAPGLLSTTIACPGNLPKGSEMVRATMSLALPDAKVTTVRMGFSGQADGGAAQGRSDRQHAVSRKVSESAAGGPEIATALPSTAQRAFAAPSPP